MLRDLLVLRVNLLLGRWNGKEEEGKLKAD
jgi:hypothetical protein